MKLLIGALATTVVLAGCGETKTGLYDNKEGQVLRISTPADINTLDSTLATDNVSFGIFNQVFEGLYTLNDKDEAVPAVAKGEPKITQNGKRWTIDLRDDAKWSNGDKVTAHDFVYAWRKAVDPKNASEYAYIMYFIKNAQEVNTGKKKVDELGVKALNDYKIQIDLDKPVPYFKEMLAFGTYMPQNERVSKKYGQSYGTKYDKVVYNGPFKIENWRVEDKVQLVKNEDYWDKKAVKLDKINYKVLKDPQAGAALYETDSVDITAISTEQVNKYEGDPGVFKRLLASTFYLKMNQKEVPEFKNKDLRMAIAKSINKSSYTKSVLNTGAQPFDGFTAKLTAKTPDGKDFADTVKSPLNYDPKEAKAHLEKAKKALGKKEFTFTINTEDTPDSKISVEFIKSQIETTLPGVNVKVKQLPFKQRLAAELSMNYSMSLSGWGPDYPDPLTFQETMRSGASQNNTGWSNKTYDKLLDEANGPLLLKEKERTAALQKAEEILLNDAPIAPIYQKGVTQLRNPQLKNVMYHQIGGETTYKYAYFDKSIDRETGKKKK